MEKKIGRREIVINADVIGRERERVYRTRQMLSPRKASGTSFLSKGRRGGVRVRLKAVALAAGNR